MQHHWSQCDLLIRTQQRQLRHEEDELWRIRRAGCNTFLQFLAYAIQHLARPLFVRYTGCES